MTEPIKPGLNLLRDTAETGRERRGFTLVPGVFDDMLNEDGPNPVLDRTKAAAVADETPRWRLAEKVVEFSLPRPLSKKADEAEKDEADATALETPARTLTLPSEAPSKGPEFREPAAQAETETSGSYRNTIHEALPHKSEAPRLRDVRGQAGRQHASETLQSSPNGHGSGNLSEEGLITAPGQGLGPQKADILPSSNSAPAARIALEKPVNDAREQIPPSEEPTPVRVLSIQTVATPVTSLPAQDTAEAALLTTFEADGAARSEHASAAEATAQSRASVDRPIQTLRIQLHPVELGVVTAQLTLSGEQLKVEIQVESTETRHRLQADGDGIMQALRAMGYDVDRITIQQVPNSTSTQSDGGAANRGSSFQAGANQGQQGSSGDSRGYRGSGYRHPSEAAERRQDAAAGNGIYI